MAFTPNGSAHNRIGFYNTDRLHSALVDTTSEEAYGVGRPVEINLRPFSRTRRLNNHDAGDPDCRSITRLVQSEMQEYSVKYKPEHHDMGSNLC